MKLAYKIARKIRNLVLRRPSGKGESEIAYWIKRKTAESILRNDHYEQFYTSHFGLDKAFYAGKIVLDIGCGPRGSLEWADVAAERVGLDPLADEYLKIGADKHQMRYVASGAENAPFDDGHFDIVCSFNSLDHVDNLDTAIESIKRLVAPGGCFLLLTDVNHDPTDSEPIEYSFDIVEKFGPELKLVEERHYEKNAGGLYESILELKSYDHSNKKRRYGILSAKFLREA